MNQLGGRGDFTGFRVQVPLGHENWCDLLKTGTA